MCLRGPGGLRGPPSIGIFVVMRAATLKQPSLEIHVRAGIAADLEELADLETKVVATDRMSRRSLRMRSVVLPARGSRTGTRSSARASRSCRSHA